LLLHEDGMSYKDLARIVGVNATSIAPLLARARQRFLRSMATSTLDNVNTSASS
jgi:DNA-directed RNA polymerase specialized sigma24 family protein